MYARRLNDLISHWRALGPYVLVELLLPGGTLIALLLWIAQRLSQVGMGFMPPRPADVAAISAPPHYVSARLDECAGACALVASA